MAVAALFSLVACQSEDSINSAYENDDNAVKITAAIAETALQTRANTEGSGGVWQKDDQIKVVNASSNAVSGKDTAVYQYDEDNVKWNLQGTDYMVWANGDADGKNTFHAWFPATAAYDAFELPAIQNTMDLLRSADWMTATPAALAKPSDKTLSLTFEHKLAKVTVIINDNNNQFTGEETVGSPKFKVATSELASGVTATEIDAWMTSYPMLEEHPYFIAVMCPGKYTTDTDFLTFTVDTTTLTVQVPDLLVSTGLEAGKAYTFNLTAGKNAVTIGSVSVNDWGASDWDNVGNGGIASNFYSGSASELLNTAKDALSEEAAQFTRWVITDEGTINANNDIKTALGLVASANADRRISLELPNATSIDKLALYDCTSLSSVNLPNVTNISGSVFWNCTSLSSVSLPNVTSIANAAFRNCTSLVTLTFGTVITNWGSVVLYGATPANITLTLNAAQTGVSGNTFQDYTFKEIILK